MIKKKFSLMEMLIVMAIMMLLFSIGVVAFSSAASKSEIVQCKSEIAQLKAAIEMYRDRWGFYPYGTADYTADFDFAEHLSKGAVGDSRLGTGKRKMFIDYNKAGFDTENSTDYDDVTPASETYLVDPWGTYYIYSYDADTDNFIVVSPGPDNTTATVDWDSSGVAGVAEVAVSVETEDGPFTSNGE